MYIFYSGHLKGLMDDVFHVKDTERRLWLKKLPNNYILLKEDEDKLENFTLSGDNLVRYLMVYAHPALLTNRLTC